MIRSYIKDWYRKHSSQKDEYFFAMCLIIAGILILSVFVATLGALAAVHPIVRSIMGWAFTGIIPLWLLWYIFRVKDPYYKKKPDPLDKKSRTING